MQAAQFYMRVSEVVGIAIGSIFSLGAGLSQMFEKLALRHGFSEAALFRIPEM